MVDIHIYFYIACTPSPLCVHLSSFRYSKRSGERNVPDSACAKFLNPTRPSVPHTFEAREERVLRGLRSLPIARYNVARRFTMRRTGPKNANLLPHFCASCTVILSRSAREMITRCSFVNDAVSSERLERFALSNVVFSPIRATRMIREHVYNAENRAFVVQQHEQVYVTRIGFRCKCGLRAYKITQLCRNKRAPHIQNPYRKT